MKGDFSRITFNPKNHFTRVLMQQGRVQLDSDWNDQADLLFHRMATDAVDLIGPSGVPAGSPGFGITVRTGLEFDGIDDYVYVGPTEGLSLANAAYFTIEALLNPYRSETDSVLVGKFNTFANGALQGGYRLYIKPDGTVWFEIASGAASVNTSHAVSFDRFTHIAVIYDRGVITIYLDGEAAASQSYASPGMVSTIPLLIGADYASDVPADFFCGIIDEIRIWQIARTEEQIRGDMYRLLQGDEDDLIAAWRVEAEEQELAVDFTGNGHIGYLGNEREECKPGLNYQLWISQGRCYVDGILCEYETDTPLTQQPDAPGVTLPTSAPAGEIYLVYLDTWQRFISAIGDPTIREVALGGPDTTARSQTIAQVKLLPVAESIQSELQADTALPVAEQVKLVTTPVAQRFLDSLEHQGMLCMRRQQQGTILENHLYRVEIHDSGWLDGSQPSDVLDLTLEVEEVLPEYHQVIVKNWTGGHHTWSRGRYVSFFRSGTTQPEGDALARIVALNDAEKRLTLNAIPPGITSGPGLRLRRIASFTWSRDNGSIAFPIRQIDGERVTLFNMGQDVTVLQKGNWVEVVDDDYVLQGRAAALSRIIDVDIANVPDIVVTLNESIPTDIGRDQTKHPLLRRWDVNREMSATAEAVRPVQQGTWLPLEDGIEISFAGAGPYRTGDYWWAPARTITQNIDWPQGYNGPKLQPPHGIQHHYAPLALLWFEDTQPRVLDLRIVFAPLSTGSISTLCGVIKGPLTIDSSLQVRGNTFLDGEVFAGTLHGSLGPDMVATPQIVDEAVTYPKLAPEVGVVPPGACILAETPYPPPGYSYTGASISHDNDRVTWTIEALLLPQVGGVTTVTAMGKIYALWDSGMLWEYDPMAPQPENGWVRKQDIPLPRRRGFGVGVVQDKIYVVGGSVVEGVDGSGAYSNQTDEYDPETDAWSPKNAMPTPRSHMGVGVVDEQLYAIGGRRAWFFGLCRGVRTSVNEAYDPFTNTWYRLAPMPTARSAFGVGSVKGRLYAIGGERSRLWCWFGRGRTGRNEVYSPAINRWKISAPMAVAKSHFGVGVVADQLYTVGGEAWYGLVAETEVYKPATDTWDYMRPLNFPRRSCGVVVDRGTMRAMGGVTTTGATDSIEEATVQSVFYIYRKDSFREPVAPADSSAVGPTSSASSSTSRRAAPQSAQQWFGSRLRWKWLLLPVALILLLLAGILVWQGIKFFTRAVEEPGSATQTPPEEEKPDIRSEVTPPVSSIMTAPSVVPLGEIAETPPAILDLPASPTSPPPQDVDMETDTPAKPETKPVVGVDTSFPVAEDAIAQATQVLGEKPLFWGRYFAGPTPYNPNRYDPTAENALLGQSDIRLLPVGDTTPVVGGDYASGKSHGTRQAEAYINALGEDNLLAQMQAQGTQGNGFYFVLDVEFGKPAAVFSADYYRGWSQAVETYHPNIKLLPSIYMSAANVAASQALSQAVQQGAKCYGLWIAGDQYYRQAATDLPQQPPRWGHDAIPQERPACYPSNPSALSFDGTSCPVLFWQYGGDIGSGPSLFDLNMINPNLNAQDILRRIARPPTSVPSTPDVSTSYGCPADMPHYIVQRDQTLYSIAQQQCGSSNLWTSITRPGGQPFTASSAAQLRIGERICLPAACR